MKKNISCVAIAALVLTGCMANPYANMERDTSAHAILDYENNRIIMPLDAYSPYFMEQYQGKALDILNERCFKEKSGIEVHGATRGASIMGQGREYGLWNPEYTARYGLLDRATNGEKPSEEYTKVYEKYMRECYEGYTKPEIEKIGNTHPNTSTYMMIHNQAIGAAASHKDWKEAREKWFTCLRSKGLTPRTDEGSWSVVEESGMDTSGPPSEEEIRIATIEAQCSKDTGMAQTLADLVASYQAPLIKKHEVQLQKELDEYKANNEKFKKFVLDNQ
ncbi:MAG: hypothetical protein Q4P78_06315 [Rothia sp. (in: high G+C Gram-positive bacteria)]|uniref:hypothetical protein n=1 Tax=Rothia sp. (in: high G+C Gram-positive bacteria) TaxID=1885016 RepID=UPI0026E052B6|nr:hypothetical protein [Rothia sp. (in: high G+C Gram-positive bacteria)]MDO5750803.1 hypothetical protein [Rothia sp. (in: high G+C Gram-positive bacteria)]